MRRAQPSLRSKWALYLAGAPVLFAAGVVLAFNFDVAFSMERADRLVNRNGPARYAPSYRLQPGPQLVMVYVGSSTCPWSNRRELSAAIEAIKLRLADQAREHGLSFKVVGLTNDWSPDAGLEHLRNFGRFDEVGTGYGWGGTLAQRYLRSEGAAEPVTPQVIVYTRTFVAPGHPADELMYGERDRRTVATRREWSEIAEWATNGVLLPEAALTGS